MKTLTIILLTLTMCFAQHTTDANTIGLWHMDESGVDYENGKRVIFDSSGNNFSLLFSGSSSNVYVTRENNGAFGRCINLSHEMAIMRGIYDHPTVDYSLFNLAKISIEIWVYWETEISTSRIVSKPDAYNLWINGNKLGFTLPGLWDQFSDPVTLELQKWHYIAVSYDREYVKFYLDGELVSVHERTNAINVSDSMFRVGCGDYLTYKFSGKVDELRISNIARDSSEIAIHFAGNTTKLNPIKIMNNKTLITNYPNPFKSSTKISISIPKKDMVSLNLYNIQGKLVSALINKELEGTHNILFEGKNITAGTYIYRLKTSKESISKILLKR